MQSIKATLTILILACLSPPLVHFTQLRCILVIINLCPVIANNNLTACILQHAFCIIFTNLFALCHLLDLTDRYSCRISATLRLLRFQKVW